jgi:hypothetical protein
MLNHLHSEVQSLVHAELKSMLVNLSTFSGEACVYAAIAFYIHVCMFAAMRLDLCSHVHDVLKVSSTYKHQQCAHLSMQDNPNFPGIILCSDGWKSKAAMQGMPLVNVLVLKPDGGFLFLKVILLEGVWIR